MNGHYSYQRLAFVHPPPPKKTKTENPSKNTMLSLYSRIGRDSFREPNDSFEQVLFPVRPNEDTHGRDEFRNS